MKIKLIHNEWSDNVYLNIINNRLYRDAIIDEYGSFILDKNILYINWDKWGNEVFIKNNEDYYYTESINLFHFAWEDICYIDNINNIIYRKSNFTKGFFSKEYEPAGHDTFITFPPPLVDPSFDEPRGQ
jgi:hypothetical protein